MDVLAQPGAIQLPDDNNDRFATSTPVTGFRALDETRALLTLADGRTIRIRLVASPTQGDDQADQDGLAELLVDISSPDLDTRDKIRQRITLDMSARRWCLPRGPQDERARSPTEVTDTAPPNAAAAASIHLAAQRPHAPGETVFTWAKPPIPTDFRERCKPARRFYKNGNYRLYAPPLDYERILDEAKAAYEKGTPLLEVLEVWRDRYRIGKDLTPITRVLSTAGLISPV